MHKITSTMSSTIKFLCAHPDLYCTIHTIASFALTRVKSAADVVAKRSLPHILHPRSVHSTLCIISMMSILWSISGTDDEGHAQDIIKHGVSMLLDLTLYRPRRMLLMWATYAPRFQREIGGTWPSLWALRPLLRRSLRLKGRWGAWKSSVVQHG